MQLKEFEKEFPNVKILRLAPYTYLMNPIELMCSAFKSHVNRMLHAPMTQIMEVPRQGMAIAVNSRMQELEIIAAEAIDKG